MDKIIVVESQEVLHEILMRSAREALLILASSKDEVTLTEIVNAVVYKIEDDLCHSTENN